MNLFFCNTPYLIEVNETNQIASKVELFIWNDTEPTEPTYTFEKTAPSTSVTANYYDIAPFVKEFVSYGINTTTSYAELDNQYYAKIKVKRYSDTGSGLTLLDTTEYFSLIGTSQDSTSGGTGLLINDNYYYYNEDVYVVILTSTLGRLVRWTALSDGTVSNSTLTANKLYVINATRVISGSDGNKVELRNTTTGTLKLWYFRPIEECKYTPVKIEFANQYGALFKTWFYKASKESFAVDNQQFRHLQTLGSEYYVGKQRQTFNTIGKQQITVNSGWVDESYSYVIKDILMSEYILLDGQYALIDSKSIDIQKHINNKLINYQLTFTLANDFRR